MFTEKGNLKGFLITSDLFMDFLWSQFNHHPRQFNMNGYARIKKTPTTTGYHDAIVEAQSLAKKKKNNDSRRTGMVDAERAEQTRTNSNDA